MHQLAVAAKSQDLRKISKSIELWEILDEIRKSEGTISIISTAYMQEAAKMDKILLFDEQEIIALGTSSELINSVRSMSYTENVQTKESCIHILKSIKTRPTVRLTVNCFLILH